ncbi:TorF family putative porin [Aestuariibacter salexigens]|uniref:TorF family putative porin n=1 Tax=Aestuariibacter salexigens TaxID=226010 RepID=UPI0006847C74|nr:TorF family putative porin [Aestuariibacter salexigens]
MRTAIYVGLPLLFLSHQAAAELSATASVVSDYVFRGISQTDSSPALQGSIDYAHEGGMYIGAWASNVDFGDDANVEIDYYLGFSEDIGAMTLDVSLVYYTYTGYESEDESDYGEVIIGAGFGDTTLTLAHAIDYVQSGESVTYIGASHDIALPYYDLLLTLNAGYSFGEDALGSNYADYGATLSKTFNGIDTFLAIYSTDISDDDTADARVVVGASYSF